MNAKSVVAISLIWTGVLVVLSRHWLGDVRAWVQSATASASPSGQQVRGPQ